VQVAFKEWAVVVDALGRGEQIVILRKGGIGEERGGFAFGHKRFLLFPTQFHQQRESVVARAQARFDSLPGPANGAVRIEFLAEIADCRWVEDGAALARLRGQHVWREEVLAERFAGGRAKGIHAVAARVFRLAQPVDVPVLEKYGGCKSWVELDVEVPAAGAQPVLTDEEFFARLRTFEQALLPAAD
jgi:hypothetical protein